MSSSISTIPPMFIEVEAITGLGSLGGTILEPNPAFEKYNTKINQELQDSLKMLNDLQSKRGKDPRNWR